MNLIINFTPTGMIPTKNMTSHVPVSVQEIVEEVHEAVEIGITMVHLHARDAQTAKELAQALGLSAETIVTGTNGNGVDIKVILGSDYQPASATPAP